MQNDSSGQKRRASRASESETRLRSLASRTLG
jgi:hypothetical protein